MKLIVRNLGSIKNNTQAIDLSRNFFVFVGRNNSGKSYVAQLLWTIFNEDVIRKFARNNFELIEDRVIDNLSRVQSTPELIDKILNTYASFLEQELKRYTFNIGKNTEVLNIISMTFTYQISDLKERGYQASFTIKDIEGNSINYLEVKKEKDSLLFQVEEKKLPTTIYNVEQKKVVTRELNLEKKTSLIASIIRIMLQHEHETFFLPASRSFFPIFYSYIYDIERKQAEQNINNLVTLIGTKRDEEPIKLSELQQLKIFQRSYTEPMNKVFERLYALNYYRDIKNEEFYLNLVQQLQAILGGKINSIRQEGIAPIEFYLKLDISDRNLPMYLASSSVNQLTLLYLYLKYWVAENNNFLIMDEPEENLHPENQVSLLNILLQFVRERDNKVLITTHSPILANAINNYIYLDVLKNQYKVNVQNIIEEHQLKYVDSSVSISKEKVGVYFFTGDQIIDYESGDYGVYFRNFREVENNLDKSLRILTDYIYRQEDESEDE